MAALNSIVLPKLNGLLLETLAASIRHVWKNHRRICGWAMYLDFASGQWNAFMPPQMAGTDGVSMDLTFTDVPRQEVPNEQLRLAGTVRAAMMRDEQTLLTELPPIDGLHVTVYPELDWLAISTHLHIGGKFEPVDAAGVLHDPSERIGSDLLNNRVRLDLPHASPSGD